MPRWVTQQTAAALTVAGLVFYGVIRLSYATFYDAFGVDPEDVGVTYTSVITRAWPGILFFAVLMLVAFFGMSGIILWLNHRQPPSERLRLRWFMVGFAVLLGLAFVYTLPNRANDGADQVKRGHLPPLASGLFDWDLWDNPLSLHVEDVRLVWADGSPPAGLGVRPGGTVTYLGRTSDTVVIYDRAQHRTIRVPASSVVLVNPVKPPPANT